MPDPKKMDALTLLQKEMRACRQCLEAGYAITPGAIFSGMTGAKVMIIGQAPGVTEVEAGRPFNAGSGRRLFEWLGAAGWLEDTFRKRHYMSAATKCYPGKSASGKGDRVPSKAEQELCRPFLLREVEILQPRLVIPVGRIAIQLFYASDRKLSEIIGTALYLPAEDIVDGSQIGAGMGRVLSEYDPSLPPNGRWIVPLPHPSGASLWPNKAENRALIDKSIEILAHLRREWNL
jgi:uracil-DNA glycosylase